MQSEVWPRKDAERTLAARASGFGCLVPGVRCASAAGARKGACALLCGTNQVDRWIDGQPYVRCGIVGMAGIVGIVGMAGVDGMAGIVGIVGIVGTAGIVGIVGIVGTAGIVGIVDVDR